MPNASTPTPDAPKWCVISPQACTLNAAENEIINKWNTTIDDHISKWPSINFMELELQFNTLRESARNGDESALAEILDSNNDFELYKATKRLIRESSCARFHNENRMNSQTAILPIAQRIVAVFKQHREEYTKAISALRAKFEVSGAVNDSVVALCDSVITSANCAACHSPKEVTPRLGDFLTLVQI